VGCAIFAVLQSPTMILMETHESIPRLETGAFIQQCLHEGAVIIVVTPNPDGRTCTVSVQRE